MDWFLIWLFSEYGILLFTSGLAAVLIFIHLVYRRK